MNLSPELKKRIGTAVLGVAVVLLLIIFGGRPGVALIAVVISLGMIWEFGEITLNLSDKKEKKLALLGTTWLIAFANFWLSRHEYELLLVSFLGMFAYFLFTAGRHEGQDFGSHFHELIRSVFGLLYLAFLPLYLVLLRDSAHGSHWVILFLLIVWAGDSGAYFSGLKFGRRKLYPLISPKKTWEGAIGGLGSGLVVAILYKLLLFRALSLGAVILTSLLVGVAAIIGDLGESYLKRAFDKKDSGSILPGHGGFLDRFDGVVFSLPLMYACTRLFS